MTDQEHLQAAFETLTSAKSKALALTDLGNAERLVHHFGSDIRFCPDFGRWLIYQETKNPDGSIRSGRWVIDKGGEQIHRLAQRTVRLIYGEAPAEDSDEKRQRIVKHAIASERSPRLVAIEREARSLEQVQVSANELDQDAGLLKCANGVVDLTTGTLRPPQREDLITRIVPVEYDPEAPRDTWISFLHSIFTRMGEVDVELCAYAQRLAGYAITGDPRERILPIFWGTGRNGKSTFVETLIDTLGPGYADVVDPSLIYSKRDESRVQQQIARLRGLRLVAAAEGSEDQKLDSALVKRLTGRDTITGRELYQREFSFKPTHVIILTTNHRPRVMDTTASTWDRLRLFPFNARFVTEDDAGYGTTPIERRADRMLSEKLRKERAGILAWLVEGAIAYAKHGLPAPKIVIESTRDYQAGEDVVGRFLVDACVIDSEAAEPFKALYQAYVAWHGDAGEGEPLGDKTFGRRLTEKGFPSETRGSGKDKYRVRAGLRLLTESDESGTNTSHGTNTDHGSEKSPQEAYKEKFTETSVRNGSTSSNGSKSHADGVRTFTHPACGTEVPWGERCPTCHPGGFAA